MGIDMKCRCHVHDSEMHILYEMLLENFDSWGDLVKFQKIGVFIDMLLAMVSIHLITCCCVDDIGTIGYWA